MLSVPALRSGLRNNISFQRGLSHRRKSGRSPGLQYKQLCTRNQKTRLLAQTLPSAARWATNRIFHNHSLPHKMKWLNYSRSPRALPRLKLKNLHHQMLQTKTVTTVSLEPTIGPQEPLLFRTFQ